MRQPVIYTVGHSTRTFDELVNILHEYDISILIDVRSMPRSRHTPQFNKQSLVQTLPKRDITYKHLSKLGGLRRTTKDSINKGWRNTSFRGYADYMQTTEFKEGLDELLSLAQSGTVAIMCAEAVPWRCHRSMIGDALLVHAMRVKDIFDLHKVQDEKITSFAHVNGTRITYPDTV